MRTPQSWKRHTEAARLRTQKLRKKCSLDRWEALPVGSVVQLQHRDEGAGACGQLKSIRSIHKIQCFEFDLKCNMGQFLPELRKERLTGHEAAQPEAQPRPPGFTSAGSGRAAGRYWKSDVSTVGRTVSTDKRGTGCLRGTDLALNVPPVT